MDRRQFLVAGLAAVSLPACGYSLSGRGSFLPASIRIIGVPLFTNLTSIYEIERPVTERVFPLKEAQAAYDLVASDTTFGKVVLAPDR